MMIRSMSPVLIAVDEIGKKEDIDALAYVMNCGCQILATVHGSSVEDVYNKPVLKMMIEDKMFKRYIVLGGAKEPGKVKNVLDEMGNVLYTGELEL